MGSTPRSACACPVCATAHVAAPAAAAAAASGGGGGGPPDIPHRPFDPAILAKVAAIQSAARVSPVSVLGV